MFNFSMPELILVLIIALVVFGPGKLPEIGKALGKGLNEFKGAVGGDKQEETETTKKTETLDAAKIDNNNSHKE